MLALVVVCAVAITAVQAQVKSLSEANKAMSAPTTTTPPPPPPPEHLSPNYIPIDVFVNANGLLANDPGAIEDARNQMRAKLVLLEGRRVGIAMTFGTGSSLDIQRGIRLATAFNDQVLRAMGPQFQDSVFRNFFQGGPDPNKVTTEVYVFER